MIKKYIKLPIIAVFITITSLVNPASIVHAQTLTNPFYANNLIPWYDPTAEDVAVCSASSGSSDLNISGSENAEKIFSFFTSNSFSTNGGKPMNDIQAASFVGNFMKEAGPDLDTGSVNPSSGAFGLAQWLGSRQTELIAFANGKEKSIETQLAFVKQELEGGESAIMSHPAFKEGKDIAAVTVAIRRVYERPGEFEADDPTRIKYAKDALSKFGGSGGSSDSGVSGSVDRGCASSNAVKGDLLKTAFNFAWDKTVTEGKWTKADAKPSYVAAMAEHSNINNDADATSPFSDCGRFVSNVMRASGIDPDYPLVHTDTQAAYVRGKPDKYQIIESPKMSDLKPGDIVIWSAHTAIYTGGSTYDTVDASLHVRDGQGRVPSQHNMMSQFIADASSQMIIARVK